MSSFFVPRRKALELVIMIVSITVIYLITQSREIIALFSFGFIWNWSASNDLGPLFENKRYRMSLLKMVVNIQGLILKPFKNTPDLLQRLLKTLPAGIFWTLIIFMNESSMPWWATFLGSFAFELMQLELGFLKRHKETL